MIPTIQWEYMHQDVRAHTIDELMNHLNNWGKSGWCLVSHSKADRKGYASLIFTRPVTD